MNTRSYKIFLPLRFLLLCLCITLVSSTHSYFVIKEPQASAQWSNGAVNVVTWEKGVQDDITHFDMELVRLSKDGVTYIAYNVEAYPASPNSLNIYLEDIPTGDDYFLLFLNSTLGLMHCLSSRFAIINTTGVTSSASVSVTPDSSIPIVTISGSPNPTKGFVTTFASRASSIMFGVTSGHKCGGAMVLAGALVGAVLVLW
ncbi:uncharacterized protein BT62DRAFT_540452 [Guyanagaster necrorhizus]|uniref:Uncharacterized protein n=1 Tax=Guyanagaster necrorhizus TaxID=856835 RepID=A0A9P7W065_9AGAR|nr:uncharacterized protein BT62DRAFT_540452 [Guyanagaster necrorhizus MCA 3950]KAG7450856.1 hypothetical protein BT62DRAFT_540452 [Guyanagaster necrorhizus MCA 3950]